MRAEYPLLRHARLTLEVLSPLSIASGKNEALVDTALARDANGLPALPGSSLAGVLRASFRREQGDEAADLLFGHAERVAGKHAGAASRLGLSWGHIHDCNNRPVDGLEFARNTLEADAILRPLLADKLPHRDHVRLGHRGTGEDRSKHDRTYVPAGHRFTFDLFLESAEEGDEEDGRNWNCLLSLLARPGFRLGGATRRGYGEMGLLGGRQRLFDLRQAGDRKDWARVPARLDGELPPGYETLALEAKAAPNRLVVDLHLQAEDFWRAGGGNTAFGQYEKTPDALPYSERGIVWSPEGKGQPGELQPVLPGAGIKGALAHRTAFHANRFAGNWAGEADPAALGGEVQSLFGRVAGKDEDGESTGHAGRVFLSDVRLPRPEQVQQLQHNGLDRFTGGVRDGALFAEEALYRTDIVVRLEIDTGGDSPPDAATRRAFLHAIKDLAEGRLALGAAQARGHGYFRATRALPHELTRWLDPKENGDDCNT